jgi:hypothetical protein
MCLIYGISFLFSLGGIFGVGHLFAGAPSRAIAYFIAGAIWSFVIAGLGIFSGGFGFLCFVPLHLLFAHFCAADAVKIAREGQSPRIA